MSQEASVGKSADENPSKTNGHAKRNGYEYQGEDGTVIIWEKEEMRETESEARRMRQLIPPD